MSLYRSFGGVLTVELTSADIAGSMNRITGTGISIDNIKSMDDLSVQFDILRRQFPKLNKICERAGDSIRIVKQKGIYWRAMALLHRPVLLFGLILIILLSVFIPGRVFFIEVEGNDTVPTRQILDAAQRAGVSFGARRRSLRSEQIKNQLLGQIPDLKWAGVNTNGCTALITVRERDISEEQGEPSGVSSIVAVRDGVVRSCTVTQGTALCIPGQAVRQGEVLISGYMDLDLCVRATRAKGEVFAETEHELTALTPTEQAKRSEKPVTQRKFSLIIGKKRINFFQASRISDASCVKMYSEYALTLPGGFVLPIILEVQTLETGDLINSTLSQEDAAAMLSGFARDYLLDQMVAGEIHYAWESVRCDNGIIAVNGRYACMEMIGRQRTEKIGEYHEAD